MKHASGILILLFILCGCMVLAGCSGIAPALPAAAGAREAQPPAPVSDQLRQLIENEVRAEGIPGIQIGIATPAWTWNGAAGNASEITGEPAEPGMRFLIASVSKTFTSVAIQKLAAEGKLSLEDPIDHWLPPDLVARIPSGHAITVRQLLDHTSGIADYDEDSINLQELENPDLAVPYQAGLEQGLKAGPLYPPGTNYTYSNVNYILLALIADRAAGMPYEEYVTRTIFVPLGMNDTYFPHTNRIPGPHMKAELRDGNGTIRDFSALYIQFDRGAGDIVSTTADLNRFHRALREGRILDSASLAAMERPTPQSGKAGYGLGYSTEVITPPGMTVRGHTGGYPGSFTLWYYVPERDTYLTVNVNYLGSAPEAGKKLTAIRAAVLTEIRNVTPARTLP
jgi:D-alanyl-D-alanine carboxypeptidase